MWWCGDGALWVGLPPPHFLLFGACMCFAGVNERGGGGGCGGVWGLKRCVAALEGDVYVYMCVCACEIEVIIVLFC